MLSRTGRWRRAHYNHANRGAVMIAKLPPGTFFGEARRRISCGGLMFTETVYSGGMVIPAHEHPDGYLSLTVEGSHTQLIGGRAREVTPRALTVHPPGEIHANRWHGAGGRCLNIEVAPARLDQIRQYAPSLDEPGDFRGGTPNWLAVRLYDEFRRADGPSPLALEGLALELLAETSRSPAGATDRRPPPWLMQAEEVLRDCFAEDLPLATVADEVGVHPAHLGRAFRRHFGCTPGDYVRGMRVEFARQRLATSDDPLVEVALAAGYSDQSHFTNAFKRHTGVTPAVYRAMYRPRSPDTRDAFHVQERGGGCC
jgi:AraC family transcriptional regulator